jgi:8-oxo-dGTP pyrophosphatase MutT (NUDIX family)
MSTSAGIFFYHKPTKHYLFLLRNDKNNQSWSIPGGKLEKGETIYTGLQRECMEELSFDITGMKLIPIQQFVNLNFTYHTFFCEITEQFIPILNNEHCGYAWVKKDYYPKPLHPGLFSTINFEVVKDKLKLIEGN